MFGKFKFVWKLNLLNNYNKIKAIGTVGQSRSIFYNTATNTADIIL